MIKYLLAKRFVRYLVMGGLNTLFGFVIYGAFVFLNMPTWAALLGGNLAGIVFNFFTMGGIVFKDLSIYRMPLFVLCYLVVYLINLESIAWMTPITGGRVTAQAVLALPMAVFSYLLLANLVFRKQNGAHA